MKGYHYDDSAQVVIASVKFSAQDHSTSELLRTL